jgi:hypothetical protein
VLAGGRLIIDWDCVLGVIALAALALDQLRHGNIMSSNGELRIIAGTYSGNCQITDTNLADGHGRPEAGAVATRAMDGNYYA